ncbi:MAG: hypothetical protein UHN93_05965 [Alistipes sp.]|nr:hypothetical protein [Alistipes sp.]
MNRVLGIIFSIVAIAVMVFAVLNWGNYTSLCFTGEDTAPAEEVVDIEETTVMDEATEVTDIQETAAQEDIVSE